MTDLRYPTSRPEMDSNRVVLAEFPRPEAWTEDAACRNGDPEDWFPTDASQDRSDGAPRAAVARAVKVCTDCPVRAQCLDYAIRMDETWGVWGGVPERERNAFLKKRRAS